MSSYPNGPGDPYQDDSYQHARGGGWGGWAALAVIVALVFVVGGVVFLAVQDPAEPVEKVAVADIRAGAEASTGATIEVGGEINDILTEHAMTISDEGSDEPLLVLVPRTTIINGIAPAVDVVPAAQVLPAEGPVQILGTVESFDHEAMAAELGIVLNEELFGPWQGKSVIIAQQIDTFEEPRDAATDEASGPSGGDPEPAAP